MKIGDNAIIVYTHQHNISCPTWVVTHISPNGKQIILTKGEKKVKATLRANKGGESYYALACDNYTRICFEDSDQFKRCVEKLELKPEESNESSPKLMPYAIAELFEALTIFVEKFEEFDPITPEDYADAKNAIAYALGQPLPFLGRHKLQNARRSLEKLL